VRKRKFVVTTDSNHGRKVYPNLARNMLLTSTDQLWVADITYIRLRDEFVFLAVRINPGFLILSFVGIGDRGPLSVALSGPRRPWHSQRHGLGETCPGSPWEPVVSKNSIGSDSQPIGMHSRVQSSSCITGSSQRSIITEWKRYSNQRMKVSKPRSTGQAEGTQYQPSSCSSIQRSRCRTLSDPRASSSVTPEASKLFARVSDPPGSNSALGPPDATSPEMAGRPSL